MATSAQLPFDENLQRSLVRADLIEAWAPRLYFLEAVPGYYAVVRQAVLCLCCDGRVLYIETATVGARLFKRKTWAGQVADLGKPLPVSRGFRVAKALRLYRVRDSSFVITIEGSRRVICFTGIPIAKDLSEPLRGLENIVFNIPQVGILAGWAQRAAVRVRNVHSAKRGVEAARLWRSVLEGNTDPKALPLLSESAPPGA